MRAADEVVGFASDLIAIDTTNSSDRGGPGTEWAAAEYVAEKLGEVGYEVAYEESGARGRGNVIARLAGADPGRGALLVHGHLDVVPADATEWSVHPFSGEVRDGYVWGRGAVDMKGTVAMTLAVARQLKRDGVVPPRDLIFAYLADEEAGGFNGAGWLVDHRPELFEGATEAISEVGGFSVTAADGARAYLDHLLPALAPIAESLDCSAELASLRDIVDRGASYQRQLRVAAAHDGSLKAVVSSLVRELREGRPS